MNDTGSSGSGSSLRNGRDSGSGGQRFGDKRGPANYDSASEDGDMIDARETLKDEKAALDIAVRGGHSMQSSSYTTSM